MQRIAVLQVERTRSLTMRDFRRDETGAATVFVIVMFVMMIAFTGLVIDVGRIFNIHSQASSYVDRAALAAAAELDGQSGAFARAVRAAYGDGTAGPLVPEGFRISLTGDNDVQINRMVFMSAIADDAADPYARSPLPGDTVLCSWAPSAGYSCQGSWTVATAEAQAAFVMVEATTETENFVMFPLAAALAPGLSSQASVSPQAVAGFKQEVCNTPPLAICNPYESPTGGGAFTPIIGQQIQLKTRGDSAGWAPGNFGLLAMQSDAGGGKCTGASNSAAFIRCVLSLDNPNTRCVSTRVTTAPGEKTAIHAGINVRFDIYDSPLTPTADARPSANVTKGLTHKSNQCAYNKLVSATDPNDDAYTMSLPRDPCFQSNTCGTGATSPRFGDGINANELTKYWQTNHGDLALPVDFDGSTRFDLYRYEIDTSKIPNKSAADVDDPTGYKGEDGAPKCNASSIDNPLLDRRVLIVAVMNCVENGVKGSSSNVPVIDFMEVFLTEPVNDDGDLFGEVLGVVDQGDDDGVLHEFPVLYR